MASMEADVWSAGSFLLEMKPRTEMASLFLSCPNTTTGPMSDQEPVGLIRMEDQALELAFDAIHNEDQTPEEATSLPMQKLRTKLVDIMLDPATICSVSWADAQQRLMMCKIKAEADYISFAPKTIGRLEEELALICHLHEYVERIEHQRSFHVKCRQCGQMLHSHTKGEFEFGVLPSDDWMDTSPQMDYFCGLSGSECCGAHLQKQHNHNNDGLLGIATKFSADAATHWLPGERKIVFSNSFLLFRKKADGGGLAKALKEEPPKAPPAENNSSHSIPRILSCSNCCAQLGTTLKGHPDVFKLYLAILHVYGENQQRSGYITSRFHSTESYLAWMLLNKCEHHSSVKLIVRSLDRCPHLLIWLLEPYVLLTKGILRDVSAAEKNSSAGQSPSKATSNAANNENGASISFPALKVLYKCFDAHSSKQDPRANGEDSSVGILEVPLGCCLQLTELLLASSLALPPPLRALGQFYVGFIRLKDRVD